MQRTLIPRKEWRNYLGKLQLKCPICGSWFSLGKDIDVTTNGSVQSVLYHFCDDDDQDASKGWTVLAQLEGWGNEKTETLVTDMSEDEDGV